MESNESTDNVKTDSTASPPSTPSTPTTPSTPDDLKFKTVLQVLLKTKQGDELVKNHEFKEKREKESEERELEEVGEEEEKTEKEKEGRKGGDKDSREEKSESGGEDEEKKSGETHKDNEDTEEDEKANKAKSEAINQNEINKSKTEDTGDAPKVDDKHKHDEEMEGKKKKKEVKEKEHKQKEEAKRKKSKANKEEVPPPKPARQKEEPKQNEEGNPESLDLKSQPVLTSGSSSLRSRRGQDDEVTHREKTQGHLYKRGKGPLFTWKRYYFVLKGQLLMYYYSEHDYKELAGFKGSLDLTMLEDVRAKKPGFLRSHHPFRLNRRNLKHIVLAAETLEERDHWMSILKGTLLRPMSIAVNYSDSSIPSTMKKQECERSATLPLQNSPSYSSLSESGDDQPKLIQPKKVPRVAMSPMGKIQLDSVKLRAVEMKEKEKVEEKKEEEEEEGEEEKKRLAKFGVTLKKRSMSPEEREPKEAKEKSLTPSLKRPNKNPVIPLSKSPLLSRPPEDELLKVSPETLRRGGSTERKKSPSPSIPLSKGVHSVLAKSGEEEVKLEEKELVVDVTDADEALSNGMKIHTAKNNVIRYSDDVKDFGELADEGRKKPEEDNAAKKEGVKMEEAKESGREVVDEKTSIDNERSESSSPEIKKNQLDVSQSMEDQNSSQESLSRQDSEVDFPEVSVTLKDDAESEYDQLDEDVLQNLKQRFSPDELKASEASSQPQGSSEAPLTPPSTPETASPTSVRDLQTKKETSQQKPDEGGDGVSATPPRSPFRRRSSTNESTNSSCKSDDEKKPGKFKKLFSRSRSGSLDAGRPEGMKDDTEKKRKSAFSKLLLAKLPKEKKKSKGDGSDSEGQNSSPEDKEKMEKETKSIPSISVPEESLPSSPETPTSKMFPDSHGESGSPVPEEHSKDDLTVVMRSDHKTSGNSRGSTYSYSSITSRELDPPPVVPEKTRIREKSPVHDVPRCNRPVSSLHQITPVEPEVDGDKMVDGTISLEQINAILSAKETRNKKRHSLEHDLNSRRPSYLSTTSIESDEPLPKTNFMNCDLSSSSSGSLKEQARLSDSSRPHSADLENAEAEASVVLRKSKLTESLTVGPRVSLTLPEFTVMEEEVQGPQQPHSPEDENSSQGKESPKRFEEENVTTPVDEETEEQDDYFPAVGVELRQPSSLNLKLPDDHTTGIRTSGITGLKAFIGELEEEDNNVSNVRSGISRLGHSAAVEKLKEEISDGK